MKLTDYIATTTQGVIFLLCFNGYTIWIKVMFEGDLDGGWNPYVFGGMPKFALATPGYKWYNQIYVFIDTFVMTWQFNPVGLAILFLTGYLFLKNIYSWWYFLLFIVCVIGVQYVTLFYYLIYRGYL